MALAVIDVLRRFIPRFLTERHPLSEDQRRAVRAIQNCRTPALGAEVYTCPKCAQRHTACHSCNHKACPQCGREATARWVERELGKRVGAPYFMVTFTLPAELRGFFLGPNAKEACNTFFAATSHALAEKLAAPKWLGAVTNGFTGILHTWNQRLFPHLHIHYIVPGAGLDSNGNLVRVRNDKFLVPIGPLKTAFRQEFPRLSDALKWEVEPRVRSKEWGINIQAFHTGANAIKYLGNYVCRTAIGDRRILSMDEDTVTFSWKDRSDGNRNKTMTLDGTEFVKRYLRHVLPKRMHSIRHFGFCHPAAKKNRQRIQFHSGRPLLVGFIANQRRSTRSRDYHCRVCDQPMQRTHSLRPDGRLVTYSLRGPPILNGSTTQAA